MRSWLCCVVGWAARLLTSAVVVVRSLFSRTVRESGLGVFQGVVTANLKQPLVSVLRTITDHNFASVPLVDDAGVLRDVYTVEDITLLARDRTLVWLNEPVESVKQRRFALVRCVHVVRVRLGDVSRVLCVLCVVCCVLCVVCCVLCVVSVCLCLSLSVSVCLPLSVCVKHVVVFQCGGGPSPPLFNDKDPVGALLVQFLMLQVPRMYCIDELGRCSGAVSLADVVRYFLHIADTTPPAPAAAAPAPLAAAPVAAAAGAAAGVPGPPAATTPHT